MGFITHYPPIFPDEDPTYCIHPLAADGSFQGKDHLLFVAYGGQPGYAAVVLEEPVRPEGLRELVQKAKMAGWKRFKIEPCGRGDEDIPQDELKKYQEMLNKVIKLVY